MPDTACYWPKDLGPYTHIGGLCLDRQSLRSSDAPIGAFLARALLCVSGETRPVRSHSLARLEAAIRSPDEFALTLSGVKVTGAQTLWMTREGPRAAANKTTLAPCLLDDGVWDGRFEVGERGPDQTLLALKGHGASLSPADRARLAAIAAVLRPSLPVTFDGSAKPYLPHFSGEPIAPNLPGITLHSLVLQRLRAACGQVYTERDLRITP